MSQMLIPAVLPPATGTPTASAKAAAPDSSSGNESFVNILGSMSGNKSLETWNLKPDTEHTVSSDNKTSDSDNSKPKDKPDKGDKGKELVPGEGPEFVYLVPVETKDGIINVILSPLGARKLGIMTPPLGGDGSGMENTGGSSDVPAQEGEGQKDGQNSLIVLPPLTLKSLFSSLDKGMILGISVPASDGLTQPVKINLENGLGELFLINPRDWKLNNGGNNNNIKYAFIGSGEKGIKMPSLTGAEVIATLKKNNDGTFTNDEVDSQASPQGKIAALKQPPGNALFAGNFLKHAASPNKENIKLFLDNGDVNHPIKDTPSDGILLKPSVAQAAGANNGPSGISNTNILLTVKAAEELNGSEVDSLKRIIDPVGPALKDIIPTPGNFTVFAAREIVKLNEAEAANFFNRPVGYSKTVEINDLMFVITKKTDSLIEVSIKPEGLGRLQIEVTVERGVLHAHINASESAGKEIIERNIPNILAELAKDGLNIGDFTVAYRNGKDHPKNSGKGSEGGIEDIGIDNKEKPSGIEHTGMLSVYA